MRNQASLLGHVSQKDFREWVKRIMLYEVESVGEARPIMTWNQVVE